MKRLLLSSLFLGAALSACWAQIPPLTLYPMAANQILGTPCGATGTPLWRSVCASDLTAVFAAPNTWTALQTFSGGIALPSQTANTFLAAPNGSAGVPTFRTIVSADISTALTTPGPIGSTTASTGAFTTLTAGLQIDSSSAPTASSCGTSPSVASGSANSGGQFTTGTGSPTACTITFSASGWLTNAWCAIAPANTAAKAISGGYYVSSSSKTAFTVTLATGTSSAAFNYACSGN